MAELVSLIPKWRLKKYGQEAFQSNIWGQNVADQVSEVTEFGRVVSHVDAMPVLTLWGQGVGESLLIKGTSKAELRFEEASQADPAGRYRFRVYEDVLYLEKAASAEWATDTEIAQFAPDAIVLDGKIYVSTYYVTIAAHLKMSDWKNLVGGVGFNIRPYTTSDWDLQGKCGSNYKTVARISSHPTLSTNVYLELHDARLFGNLVCRGKDIEDVDLLEVDQLALRYRSDGLDMFNIKTEKVTRDYGGSLFDAAGTTDSSTVWTQPAGTVVLGVKLRLESQFASIGMTDLDVTVGDAGDNDGVIAATMNLVSDAEDTEYTTRGAYWDEASGTSFLMKDSATDWIAYANAVGANLDTLTSGSIDFYFTYLEP